MAKKGRKSRWDELKMWERLETVEGWARQGATDEEIIAVLKVGRSTFYQWKTDHPEFAKALSAGKEIANGEILLSAYKQSVGYTVTEQITQKCKKQRWDAEAKKVLTDEVLEVVDVNKYIAPDGRIIMFMLTNRLPQDYRAKRDEPIDKDVTFAFDDLPEIAEPPK